MAKNTRVLQFFEVETDPLFVKTEHLSCSSSGRLYSTFSSGRSSRPGMALETSACFGVPMAWSEFLRVRRIPSRVQSGVAAIPTAFPCRFASSASLYSPSAFRKRSRGSSPVRLMRSFSSLSRLRRRGPEQSASVGLTSNGADSPGPNPAPGSCNQCANWRLSDLLTVFLRLHSYYYPLLSLEREKRRTDQRKRGDVQSEILHWRIMGHMCIGCETFFRGNSLNEKGGSTGFFTGSMGSEPIKRYARMELG